MTYQEFIARLKAWPAFVGFHNLAEKRQLMIGLVSSDEVNTDTPLNRLEVDVEAIDEELLGAPESILTIVCKAGMQKIVLQNEANVKKLTIDISDIPDTAGDKELKIREIDVCEGSTIKKMLIIASSTYTP
jgi:hypothetical protein